MRAIDQTRLPEEVVLSAGMVEEFAEAISSLRAPGVAGGPGISPEAQQATNLGGP